MRQLMTAPLTLLRTLFVCSATSLLIACDSGGSSSAVIPEVNSFHIYTADQSIYSFNEETGISRKRGQFEAGEAQFVEIDIDEDKPGYDYAIYNSDNGIFLLDYDKAKSGKITKLTQYATNKIICAIIPDKTASRSAFRDGGSSNRSTLDLPVVTIELIDENQSCNPLLNYRDKLDFSALFDDDTFRNDILKTARSSSAVLGGFVIDYSSGGLFINNPNIDDTPSGKTGFMGYNLTGSEIVFDFSIDGEADRWSSNLVSDPGLIPFIKQASRDQVVVQNNRDLFVLNALPLFTINTDASNIPIQSRIDDLFAFPGYELSDTAGISTNRSQNRSNFLIQQNNNLLFFNQGNFKEIPNTPIQNASVIDFDLTFDNHALVVQENPDNTQTLLIISTVSGESTTALSAERIELQVIGSEFYLNTLELEPGSGWQAHWFRSPTSSTSYNNSRLLFATDLRAQNNTLLMLSSDAIETEANLVKPTLYLFDKTQSNGRKKGVNKDNVRVDFSFGKLNTDVGDIEFARISNARYGKIILSGINSESGEGRLVREQYYFDPSQEVSSQDPDKQSLRLMSREEL
jgi:hypothetical protein